MQTETLRPETRWVPLMVLGALLVAANGLWLAVDHRPPPWDESIHYLNAVGYYEILRSPGPTACRQVLYHSDFYPPFQELLAGTVFLVTGPSPKVASVLNIAYVLAIAMLVLLLGRELFDPDVGILGAWLFAASAAVVIQSKLFMLDLPLTFFVTLAATCFVRSEGFSRTGWSFGYGLAFGLALLTKWSALFFLALPPLVSTLLAARSQPLQAGRRWRNLALSFLTAALLALPWYGVHALRFLHHASGYLYARGVLENDPPLLAPASWFYYLGALMPQMSWPLGLLALTGLIFFLAAGKHRGLWLLWVGLPYLCLTLIRNKDMRYTLPLLPWFCLSAVSWLAPLSGRLRRGLVAGVILLAGLQMAYVHAGRYAGPVHTWLQTRLVSTPLVPAQGPDPAPWPQEQILQRVQGQAASWNRTPVLRVVPDESAFNRQNFAVAQTRTDGRRVLLAGTTDWPAFTDFVVTKTGGLGLPFAVADRKAITAELLQNPAMPERRFQELARYPLPDGSEAILFARNDPAVPTPPAQILSQVEAQLRDLLAGYVRDAQALSLQIEPFSPEETRRGHFRLLRVTAQGARLGDFKHRSPGVPVARLAVEIHDVVLDLERMRSGVLLPYQAAMLVVRDFELEATQLNQALEREGGDLGKVRVAFERGEVRAAYSGFPRAEAILALRVVPDEPVLHSENLGFHIRRVTLAGWPWPGWLLQPWLEDFNPLLRLGGLPARVVLGEVQMNFGRLRLGSVASSE